MEFWALITFLVIYFIRPQDWIGFMEGMEIVRPIMIVAILGLFRQRGALRPGMFLKTPLDWVMLVYWLWIIYASPTLEFGVMGGLSLFGFYFLSVSILNTMRRLVIFLGVWTGCLVALALIGIGGEHGFDITGAHELTHTIFVDRLVINTWLFRNPNSVGHTLIIALPLLYFLLVYKRQLEMWFWMSLPAVAVAYCIYLTKSKGAFMTGFAVLTFSLLLGRSRAFQVSALALALTLGWGVVTKMPRMQELSSLETNEAVMGRMYAWQNSRISLEENFSGAGWRQFVARYLWEGQEHTIATHSSYVRIGAELGKPGLYLYLLLLCIALRQLIMQRATSATEERIIRMLVVLVFSYTLSNWMIDRAYHAEFFLMLGLCSAFCRIMDDKWSKAALGDAEERESASAEEFEPVPIAVTAPVTASRRERELGAVERRVFVPASLPPEEREREMEEMAYYSEEAEQAGRSLSPRLFPMFFFDLLLAAGAYYAVLYFWNYMIKRIL